VDSVRYYVALILLVTLPPLLMFWLLIHPFIRFWRKVGPGWTYGIVGGLIASGMAGVFLVRKPLLATEVGTCSPLVIVGILCLAAAVSMGWWLLRHVTIKVLIGLPELAPERHPGRLVTGGLYARIRHPRYVQFLLGLLGYALFADYLAAYIVVALWIPGIWAIAVLEERELRDRFGEQYEEYCRRVRRFVPRFGCGD